MQVNLIDYTIDAENKIGLAASKCYNGKSDRESNIKRAAHCKDVGHLATLRFAYATIEVLGISRVCSHQLVRIAHAGILQESQRYVSQANLTWVIPNSVVQHEEFHKKWCNYLNEGLSIYNEAIALGIKKEDARYALSQSCSTNITLCLNFQGWKDFLKNRLCKAAQWEIREVAQEIEKLLQSIAPNVFEHPEFIKPIKN